ncbi:hypothetical protein AGDE_07065 [Angomonas deanei]|uniref:HSCB C-terminal oligomerisation domain containing protein, putative n=1 Tax=Angomonas deanei TaxID=59799 RepID=A0A7G2CC24_9TRYP|nr:hypothetical protein AGDE_07065 [Angomonas deanei]CAD2217360.1 HSCB C-terminal oligomerisation domain containing protein, putative [Angomonas deanei]|eukprot:EPY36135.1 hypothetical protein AGDE_07065 [Angomonas deanei]
MSEDFLMEVMSMNELIFAGDREDEQTRHRMIILKADLEERSAEYFERATGHWQKGQLDEFHFTVGEWTYLYNALRHLKDRL